MGCCVNKPEYVTEPSQFAPPQHVDIDSKVEVCPQAHRRFPCIPVKLACLTQAASTSVDVSPPPQALAAGVTKFNVKPTKGVHYLVRNGVVGEEPRAIAAFLRNHG
jgi:hypothetical protein